MPRQSRTGITAKDGEYLAKLGDNIRAARKRKGYSQKAFADVAGFSRSYVTEIETGKWNISALNLIKIMETLDAGPNEIVGSIKTKEEGTLPHNV